MNKKDTIKAAMIINGLGFDHEDHAYFLNTNKEYLELVDHVLLNVETLTLYVHKLGNLYSQSQAIIKDYLQEVEQSAISDIKVGERMESIDEDFSHYARIEIEIDYDVHTEHSLGDNETPDYEDTIVSNFTITSA